MADAPKYERRVDASAAYDKRHPEPAKNYGIHGVEFRFSLVGEVAAVSFGLSTGWYLPVTVGVEDADGEDRFAYTDALSRFNKIRLYPLPMAIHFHVATPIRDYMADQDPRECDLLPGGKCYGDVTFTGSDRPFFALLRGGLEGMWEELATELEGFVADEDEPG